MIDFIRKKIDRLVWPSLLVIYGLILLPNLIKITWHGQHLRVGLWFMMPLLLNLLFNFQWLEELKRRKWFWFICLLIGWNFLLSLSQLSVRSVGFLFWLILNLALLIVARKRDIKYLAQILCASLALHSVWVVFQHFFAKFSFPDIKPPHPALYFVGDKEVIYRSFGFFQEPSYQALALAGVIAYLIFNEKAPWKNWILPLFYLALVFSYSRLAFLELGIFFCIFCFIKAYRSWLQSFFITFSILISILSSPQYFGLETLWHSKSSATNETSFDFQKTPMANGSVVERGDSLRQSIQLAWENKFVGVGLGNSKSKLIEKFEDESKVKDVQGVHNLYLEILVEQGIIGLIFFLLFIFYFLKEEVNEWGKRFPVIFVLLVPMMFCQNINSPSFWLILIIGMIRQTKTQGLIND